MTMRACCIGQRLAQVLALMLLCAVTPILGGCVYFAIYDEYKREEQRKRLDVVLEYDNAINLFQLTHALLFDPARAAPRFDQTSNERDKIAGLLSGILKDGEDDNASASLKLDIVSTPSYVTETTEDGVTHISVGVLQAVIEASATHYSISMDDYAELLRQAVNGESEADRDAKNFFDDMPYSKKYASTPLTLLPGSEKRFRINTEVTYLLRFVLLHELGHLRLQHFLRLKDASRSAWCEKLKAFELEADDFATENAVVLRSEDMPHDVLARANNDASRKWLNDFLTSRGEDPLPQLPDKLEYDQRMYMALTGYAMAFSGISSLHSGQTSVPGCRYPSIAERMERAKTRYELTREAEQGAANERLSSCASRKMLSECLD